eukprot:CAMPEP_0119549356 /NCGR_PEP_ID=MMETSP1352-20130426/3072_1 /TAXON_ID=265584 /ORGANISM="Stauroneis constricta, Strain CCMP1120" /LENGTH=740 /DNA_ID=CAMNT_0007594889 /DNA_START=319 /DNA_END=2537 /DNA_ORIENTATION=+
MAKPDNVMPLNDTVPSSPSSLAKTSKRSKSKAKRSSKHRSNANDDSKTVKSNKSSKSGNSSHSRRPQRGRDRGRKKNQTNSSVSPEHASKRKLLGYGSDTDKDDTRGATRPGASALEPKRRGRRPMRRHTDFGYGTDTNNNDDDDTVVSSMTMESSMTANTKSKNKRSKSVSKRMSHLLSWPLKKSKPKNKQVYGFGMSDDEMDDDIIDDDLDNHSRYTTQTRSKSNSRRYSRSTNAPNHHRDNDDDHSVRSTATAPLSIMIPSSSSSKKSSHKRKSKKQQQQRSKSVVGVRDELRSPKKNKKKSKKASSTKKKTSSKKTPVVPKSVASMDTTASPTNSSIDSSTENPVDDATPKNKEETKDAVIAATTATPEASPQEQEVPKNIPSEEENIHTDDDDDDVYIKSTVTSVQDVLKAERDVSDAREQCLSVWESELKERESKIKSIEDQSKQAMQELDTYFCSIRASRMAITQYGAQGSLQQRQDAVESIEKVLSHERAILRQQRTEFESNTNGIYQKYQKLQTKQKEYEATIQHLQNENESLHCRLSLLELEENQTEEKTFLKGEYEILKQNYEQAQSTIQEQDDEIHTLQKHIERIERSNTTSNSNNETSIVQHISNSLSLTTSNNNNNNNYYEQEMNEMKNEQQIIQKQYQEQINDLLQKLDEKNICIKSLQTQIENKNRNGNELNSSSHHTRLITMSAQPTQPRKTIGGFLSQMTPKTFRSSVTNGDATSMTDAIGP